LRLFELNDHELRTALAERRIDAALVTRHSLWPSAVSVPVYREAIVAALPCEHPLTRRKALRWALLRDETLLTQGWDDSQVAREFFASFLGAGTRFVSHATSKESILALVAAGYGVTLALGSQACQMTPGVAYRPIRERDAWVDLDLVWSPEREDAAAGVFVAFMRDRFDARSTDGKCYAATGNFLYRCSGQAMALSPRSARRTARGSHEQHRREASSRRTQALGHSGGKTARTVQDILQ
jgi:DNA-binding transcriptional LysR family regulator